MDLIEKQVDLAVDESGVIIFVVDGKTGVTPTDAEIAHKLRRSGKPVVVAMNKLDSQNLEDAMIGEAYGLGFAVEPVSRDAGLVVHYRGPFPQYPVEY